MSCWNLIINCATSAAPLQNTGVGIDMRKHIFLKNAVREIKFLEMLKPWRRNTPQTEMLGEAKMHVTLSPQA